ncbi:KAP family NTPase [Tenacibaculum dicentrarchi]|nr:KAP family NTPase [Tenacibaculum dicentrarchi]MCD8418986.1 KAP family NTPase [Tenacibaculum dicentrarchi]MCD8434312.1 KAP family NTPase [Tenacibaculum dicentrarchi]MCD8436680.1 KAP family NTPase [Tenacibaculum dicentrarchi]MCD8450793.1 KAP family NTPase [Tenacibaculum dicentrarchi]
MISNSPISKNNGIDLFNFEHYAKKVQKIIQNNSNNSEALTIGIYGKWGEGKTSFLNLINDEIDIWKDKEKGQKGILKYHFNPWRYSTEEEMLFDFFDGLSKMMFVEQETELQKISKKITEYYNYIEKIKLKGKVGFFLKILNFFAEISKKDKVTLDKIIKSINDKLKGLSYKIVVFIDDIDRLDKDEIYTILKLIKLNANFDNFVYIVALDENHVAKAIGQRYGESSEDGKLFLEKIINIPIHLPKIESADFKHFFEVKLKEVFDNLGFSDENDNEKEVFLEIIREFRVQYFKNGREIIRVLNSFFVGAFAIGEEVNLRDLFWIEYLKITDKELFLHIKNYRFNIIPKKLIISKNLKNNFKRINNENDYPHSDLIIEKLFPKYRSEVNKEELLKDVKYITYVDNNFNVNHLNHFEKYFSYHIERKSSKVKNKEIFQNIIDKNEDELRKNLIIIRDKEYLKFYRFYNLIEYFINDENINHPFFYSFLFSNLDMIPETEIDSFGLSYKLKIVELIASNLDKNNVDKDHIIQLAEKLTIRQLCYFTKNINKAYYVRNELNRLVFEKVKEEYIDKPTPFFYNLIKEHSHYKMIMSLWKENDNTSFNKYIDNQTNNFDNILKLIRNFTDFWSNSFFGDLRDTNYYYMKSIIDIDVVYQKIKEMKPELINKINIKNKMSFSISNRPSEVENVEQFIYWYKKDKNLIN